MSDKNHRDSIEILPADDPKDVKLGWVVHEYIGAEVYKDPITNAPLTNIDDIKPGDDIFAYDSLAVVNEDGKSASSQNFLYLLEFSQDDRKCWVCYGVINKKGLAKLELPND